MGEAWKGIVARRAVSAHRQPRPAGPLGASHQLPPSSLAPEILLPFLHKDKGVKAPSCVRLARLKRGKSLAVPSAGSCFFLR